NNRFISLMLLVIGWSIGLYLSIVNIIRFFLKKLKYRYTQIYNIQEVYQLIKVYFFSFKFSSITRVILSMSHSCCQPQSPLALLSSMLDGQLSAIFCLKSGV